MQTKWFKPANIISIVFFLILSNSYATSPPEHTKLLYSNSLLQNGEDNFASLTSISGNFTGNGWEANSGGRLVMQLKNRLPATGSIEFSITNFNPRLQASRGKQPIFTFTSRPYSDLSIFEDGELTSFMYLRTGTNYFTESDRCGLEFDTAYESLTSRDRDREVLMDKKWDPNKTYHFKFMWDHEYMWLELDGEIIKKQLFLTPIERIQHISIGGDELYYTLQGPIFSDVKIYESNTPITFQDHSIDKGLSGNVEKYGGHGVAVADVNMDGRDDLFVTSHIEGDCVQDLLYLQQSDGSYLEQTETAGIATDCGSFAAVFFDIDNDGDPDLFTTSKGSRNRLYVNNGSGLFTEGGVGRGLSSANSNSGGAVATDVNGDGAIDLFVTNINAANELYLNSGNGQFVLSDAGLAGIDNNTGLQFPSQVTIADVDEDGNNDIYITKRETENELYLNNGDGTFNEAAAARGLALADTTLHSAVFADYDNDGDMDLFCATGFASHNSDSLSVHVLSNNGSGYFSEITSTLQLPSQGYTLQLFDANNDGFLDLYTLGNNEFDKIKPNRLWEYYQKSYSRLFLGSETGIFSNAGAIGADISGYSARSAIANDFDQDGDLDLYLTTNKFENVYLENESDSQGNDWAQISTVGPGGDKGGIGTKMFVYAPGHLGENDYLLGYRQVVNQSGYATGNPSRQHFGLGKFQSFDIRLQRTDGSIIDKRDLEANQVHEILPSHIRLAQVSGHPQNGYTGRQVAEPLVVRVTDDQDTPQTDTPVVWSITKGSGQLDGNTTTNTDLSGLASIRFTCGDTPDTTFIQASVPGADGSPATFTVISQNPPIFLSKVSGDPQNGYIGQQVSEPFVVQVSDDQDNPLAETAVSWNIMQGNGKLIGNTITNTDMSGLASIGFTCGDTPDTTIIQASVTGAQGSPVSFTVMSHIPPAFLTKAGGDNQTGVVGTMLENKIIVRANYPDGRLAHHEPVTFKILSGEGNLDGDSTKVIVSDEGGMAAINWTLGILPGQQKLRVETADSVLEFSALAIVDEPHEILAIGGQTENSEPAVEFPEPFAIQLFDQYDNVIADFPVEFSTGYGNIRGANIQTVNTDNEGKAQVYWTPGEYLGPHQTLTAIASPTLRVQWHIPGVFVDASLSGITATTPIEADGLSESIITVSLRDSSGQSAGPGLAVFVSASGSGNILATDDTLTNADGQVLYKLSTNVPEVKIIHARVAGLDMVLADSAIAEAKNSPDLHQCTVTATSPILSDGSAQSEIEIRVVDRNGQPLPGIVVELEASGSGNTLIQPDPTDDQGIAKGLLASSVAEEKNITAFILPERTEIPTQTVVLFLENQITLNKVSGDLQEQAVGKQLEQPLVVQTLRGEYPQQGLAVEFSIESGDAHFDETSKFETVTDDSGKATALPTLGTTPGNIIIKASIEGSLPVSFKITAVPDTASHLAIVSGENQTAETGQPLPEHLVVKALDAYDNPVALVPVEFLALDGGTILSESTVLSDSSGKVSCAVALGTEAKTYHFRASLNPETFVDFSATANSVNSAPYVISYIPTTDSVKALHGDIVVFEILQAIDVQNDTIYYSWLLDSLEISNQSKCSITASSTLPQDFAMICLVHDLEDTTRLQWYVKLEPNITSVEGENNKNALPTEITLMQNYPNPFNPSTTIEFSLDESMHITLSISDMTGRTIRRLVSGRMSAGYHQMMWDGKNENHETVASGVYLCRLKTDAGSWTRKMIFIK